MAKKIKPGDEFKHLIDKVQLNDIDKESLRVQWVNELNYADKKAVQSRRMFTCIKLIVFIAGVLIPVFANIHLQFCAGNLSIDNVLITTLLGICVAIGTGVSQIFKYEDRWNLYRRNAELLKSEGENFFGLGGAYRNALDHQHALRDFNTNVASIKKQDVANYFEKVMSKDNSGRNP